MKLFKKTKKGFTLVELVVVIAVIAILSAVSVGAYFGITDSANNSRLEQEAEQIHTAIQAVSLGTDSNQSLGKDGLRVKDLDEFEKAIEKNLGVDVEVVTGETTTLKLPTIVLGNQTDLFAEHGAGTLYSTFGYLNPEIGGKKIVADVVSGDTKIVKYNFTVDDNLAPIEYTTVYWKSPFTLNGDNTYVHYVTEDGNNNGWPGTKMTHYIPVEDIFVAEVASNFTDLYFHIGTDEGNDSNQRHVERGSYSIETPYWADGGDAWAETPVAKTNYPTKDVTMYYKAVGYTEPRIWAWSVEGTNNAETFAESPLMEKVSGRDDDLYSYTFEGDFFGAKVFDGTNESLNSGDIDLSGLITGTNDFYDKDTKTWTIVPAYTPLPTYDYELYLRTNTVYQPEGTKFAAYFFGNGDHWEWMEKDAEDDYLWSLNIQDYEIEYSNVIFVSFNESVEVASWDDDINQTDDLTIPTGENIDKNAYVLPESGVKSDCTDELWTTLDNAKTVDPNVTVKETTLYLKPSARWNTDNPRYAAYFFNNGEKWVDMTDEDGDGVYEVVVPSGFVDVIFCRMNPGGAANNWNNKRNQTADLKVPTDGTNCYTVKENTWDKGGGTWSVYTPENN